MNPQIAIYLNPQLRAALEFNNIDPQTYGPAYGGESIALDLYHAAPTALTVDGVTLMPSGLHVALPPGWGAFVFGRGSIHKTDFINRAGVIDPGYSGEIFVSVARIEFDASLFSDYYRKTPHIEAYAKSPFQLVFLPCNTNLTQVTEEEFKTLHAESKRKTGSIGSSN
jgi:hypothetical protein